MKPKDNQEVFVRNLTNCQPSLYAYILSLLPNRDDANDVLQDANLVMWRRSAEFAEGTNFLAWAYKIARYKVLSHHRDQHRSRQVFDDALFAQLADVAAARLSVLSQSNAAAQLLPRLHGDSRAALLQCRRRILSPICGSSASGDVSYSGSSAPEKACRCCR